MRAPGGGGALALVCGVRGWGFSHARPPLLGACCRGPLPPGCGCVRCGCGDASPTHSARSCELALRAVVAAPGRPGEGPLAWVWGFQGWALSNARPPFLGACGRGLLPTGCGCGDVGVGTCHEPHEARSCELALGAFGTARGRPGGRDFFPGCAAPGVGRSLTPDRPSFGRAAGACYPLAVGAGDVSVGTRHLPHSTRSCELALRVVGAAQGRLGGGGAPLAWVWGVWGLALPHTSLPVLGACGWGRLPTGCWCGKCGCVDPSRIPQRALERAGFARYRGGMRAPGGGGGGAVVWAVGRPGLGALPRPTAHRQSSGFRKGTVRLEHSPQRIVPVPVR